MYVSSNSNCFVCNAKISLNWNYLYSWFPEEFTEKTAFHRHEQRPQSVWHQRVGKKKVYLLVSPSVNNVWTLLCEHPSVNCFLKYYCTMHVHAQSKFIYIYIYYTATCISPCVTICEHSCVNTCVNIRLPIASLNAIVPCMCMHKASLSTSTSTTPLPLAYHHVSPYVNNVWTLLCEHQSTNCFFKCIVPCMSMYKASLSTSTCNILPLAYHHMSPYVNTVWTLLCEHASVNCFFKSIVPCMCMYKASLSTYTSTTLPLAYHHMLPSLNIVWRLMSKRQCKIDVNAYLNCLQSDCFQIFSNWRHGSARHNGNMWVTYEYMRN